MREYGVLSYLVNGHDEIGGTEYDTVAYVFVMHPGNRLRKLRKEAKLTQLELGERVGLDQTTLSNYENDKRPMPLEHMRAIARELGCAPADLLGDEDNPERLSDEERKLLQAFRELDEQGKHFLATSAQAVAEQQQGYRSRAA